MANHPEEERMGNHLNHTADVVGQEAEVGEDDDSPGIAQPLSQAEIDELLYGDEWSAEERLERLRDFRDDLRSREAADFGTDDPGSLLKEIISAIARLERSFGEGMDPSSVDHNPEDHRETLSPDSDELEAIEQQDEASMAEDNPGDRVLDPGEWEGDDGIDTRKGAH
jgi:hypothetical protein